MYIGQIISHTKMKAKELKQNLILLYLAYKDPRLPWYVKAFTACVVAYAFSPIDLIPDFVPILGYLDDLVIVPLGITIALKMIPPSVIADCRHKAEELQRNGKPKNWATAAVFILIWVLLAVWLTVICYQSLAKFRVL